MKPESTLYLAYFKGTHFDVAVPKSNDDLVLINQELAQTPLKAQGRAPELDKSIVTKDPELSLTPLKDAIDEIMISVNEIKAIQRSQLSQTSQQYLMSREDLERALSVQMQGNVALVNAANAIEKKSQDYGTLLKKAVHCEMKMSLQAVKDVILNKRHVADLLGGDEAQYDVHDQHMDYEDTNNWSMKTLTEMEAAYDKLKNEHETLKELHVTKNELFEQQKAQFNEEMAKASWNRSILEAQLVELKSNIDFKSTEAMEEKKHLLDKLASTARKLDQKDAENTQNKTENDTAKTLLEQLLKPLASFVDILYLIEKYDDKITDKDRAHMVKTMRISLHPDKLKKVLKAVHECVKLLNDHGEITNSVRILDKHLKGEFRLFLKFEKADENDQQKKCCICSTAGFTEEAERQNFQVFCDTCENTAHLFCIPYSTDPLLRPPDVLHQENYIWYCNPSCIPSHQSC